MISGIRQVFILICIISCAFFFTAGLSAQESYDGSHDISQLLSEAEFDFDMVDEDAVLLFDGERIRLYKEGRYTKYIHRIIYINTSRALNRYRDYIIPYDTLRCSLFIDAARTWHDGRWREIPPDEYDMMIPERLDGTDDYANIHEMILHIKETEVPCILEVAYRIEDIKPFRMGWDGIRTFVREEPVVRSWFGFDLPIGWWPNIIEKPQIPAPEKETDNELGMDIFTWKRGPYRALGYPDTGDPTDAESYIIWSTWQSWESFGKYFRSIFDPALLIDESLKAILDSTVRNAGTDNEKAELIADFINDKVRYIEYSWDYWITSPRPAAQTYYTNYGHHLDRAILAAALFNKANVRTVPIFVGVGHKSPVIRVPGHTLLSDLGLWLYGENLAAYYDPATGKLTNGPTAFFSRTVWIPGVDESPNMRLNGLGLTSQYDVTVDLSYDIKRGTFIGTGSFHTDNLFNPYHLLSGINSEMEAYLQSLISSFLENAVLIDYNPTLLEPRNIEMEFKFESKVPADSPGDEIELILGEPNDGLMESLPEHVQLYHNERTSPIYLPSLLSQKIEFLINLDGLQILQYPEKDSIENATGNFSINSVSADDKLKISRILNITKVDIQPGEWPLLRTLLLADRDDYNRTILFKIDDDKNIDD